RVTHAVLCSTQPPPTYIYTLSLHDALPISFALHARTGHHGLDHRFDARLGAFADHILLHPYQFHLLGALAAVFQRLPRARQTVRSEEHTSELQSRENLVCRLLLEKKKRGTT